MLKVSFKENKEKGTLRLVVQGHAQSAPYGRDLVCAAASMLVAALIQSAIFADAEDKLERKPKTVSREGYKELIVTPKPRYEKEIRAMFSVVVNGFLALEANYADNVSVQGDKAQSHHINTDSPT